MNVHFVFNTQATCFYADRGYHPQAYLAETPECLDMYMHREFWLWTLPLLFVAKCSSKLTCEKSCGSTACRKVQRDCYCKNSYYRHPVTMECVRPEDCNRRKSTTRAAKKRRTRRTTKARSYLLTTLTTQGLRPTIFTIDTNSVILQYINISRITPRPTWESFLYFSLSVICLYWK